MRIKDIISHLEELAPPSYQESYDNAGLIIGRPDMEFKGSILCLDSTEEVVDDAIANGANLIIAHHPIVFKGLKQLNGKNYIERTIIKAIKNDIAIYAIHTNLDNVRNGVNDEIADRIGLKKDGRTILMPKNQTLRKLETYIPTNHVQTVLDALWQVGAGQIGRYSECSYRLEGKGSFRPMEGAEPFTGEVGTRSEESETKVELIFPSHSASNVVRALNSAHPYEQVAYQIIALENKNQEIGAGIVGELPEAIDSLSFLKKLKESMEAGVLKHTEICHKKIKRVAIVGGSGVFALRAAKASGAQVFITGDVKYHEFFDTEGDIILADIGHYESEQFTQQLLQRALAEKFPKFAHLLTRVHTNPVKYL